MTGRLKRVTPFQLIKLIYRILLTADSDPNIHTKQAPVTKPRIKPPAATMPR